GRHRDGADLQAAHRLDIQVFGRLPEQLAQQGHRLGVEQRLLAVDVVIALLARGEGEIAEGERPRFEQLEQPTACLGGHGEPPGAAGGGVNLLSTAAGKMLWPALPPASRPQTLFFGWPLARVSSLTPTQSP